jgi:DNA-binding CsgD family transcriptional regulator
MLMPKTSDLTAMVLAKLQYLQDLYSKQFHLSISVFRRDGNEFSVSSSQSLECAQASMKHPDVCRNHLLRLLQQGETRLSTVIVTCPFGLTTAVIPLGTVLETDRMTKADYYLVIGKIRVRGIGDTYYALPDQIEDDSQYSLAEFKEIIQLIAFNMDLLFGLVKQGKIPLERSQPVEKSTFDALTQREKEILHLVSVGMSNQEISKNLFISEQTVKVHVSNILKKLQMKNRTQLALYQIQTS